MNKGSRWVKIIKITLVKNLVVAYIQYVKMFALMREYISTFFLQFLCVIVGDYSLYLKTNGGNDGTTYMYIVQ